MLTVTITRSRLPSNLTTSRGLRAPTRTGSRLVTSTNTGVGRFRRCCSYPAGCTLRVARLRAGSRRQPARGPFAQSSEARTSASLRQPPSTRPRTPPARPTRRLARRLPYLGHSCVRPTRTICAILACSADSAVTTTRTSCPPEGSAPEGRRGGHPCSPARPWPNAPSESGLLEPFIVGAGFSHRRALQSNRRTEDRQRPGDPVEWGSTIALNR